MIETKKLISFIVCCYNSEAYMRKCVDTLLNGKEEVEIIIVDDGSKDSTGAIGDEYASKYPSIVKCIHQPNGGHGAGLQTGIENATGLYYKPVDSDDWVDVDTLFYLLDKIKKDQGKVDLYITDYQYTKGEGINGTIINFTKAFKKNEEKIISISELKKLSISSYFLIHSCMYKTEILRKADIKCPRKTFYEDDYFVYSPLPYINTLCYVPKIFYMYFVGREGQSVSKEIAIKRFRDYQKVAIYCFKQYDPYKYKKEKSRFKLMYHEIRMFTLLAVIHTQLNKVERAEAKKSLSVFYAELETINERLYKRLRYRSLMSFISPNNWFGRLISRIGYSVAHKVVHFN